MPMETKIRDKQLEKLQGFIKKFDELTYQLGSIQSNYEHSKSLVLNDMVAIDREINQFKKDIEEEYGANIIVNPQTGEITPKPITNA